MKRRANQFLTKPAVSPRAQSLTLCGGGSEDMADIYRLCEVLFKRNDLSPADKTCIEMSVYGGMRISSILSFDHKCILADLRCCVPQSKGSFDMIWTPVYCRDFVKMCKVYQLSPFVGYSRFYYYRLFKKLGLSEIFGTNTNRSVTHIGRHVQGLNFKDVHSVSLNKSQILGHKSITNLKYYEANRH